jgi:hypothetical protein
MCEFTVLWEGASADVETRTGQTITITPEALKVRGESGSCKSLAVVRVPLPPDLREEVSERLREYPDIVEVNEDGPDSLKVLVEVVGRVGPKSAMHTVVGAISGALAASNIRCGSFAKGEGLQSAAGEQAP